MAVQRIVFRRVKVGVSGIVAMVRGPGHDDVSAGVNCQTGDPGKAVADTAMDRDHVMAIPQQRACNRSVLRRVEAAVASCNGQDNVIGAVNGHPVRVTG